MANHKINMLVLDVDGTLTNNNIYIDNNGVEFKQFWVPDAAAICRWIELGKIMVWISGSPTMCTTRRANHLGVQEIHIGVIHKLGLVLKLAEKYKIGIDNIAAMGDDHIDLGMVQECGYGIAPKNAIPEVKAAAKYVTKKRGGHGAVREAIEHLFRITGESMTGAYQ